MKVFCWLGFHTWYKHGGTRTGGLFRVCTSCNLSQKGIEDRNDHGRFISWVKL